MLDGGVMIRNPKLFWISSPLGWHPKTTSGYLHGLPWLVILGTVLMFNREFGCSSTSRPTLSRECSGGGDIATQGAQDAPAADMDGAEAGHLFGRQGPSWIFRLGY